MTARTFLRWAGQSLNCAVRIGRMLHIQRAQAELIACNLKPRVQGMSVCLRVSLRTDGVVSKQLQYGGDLRQSISLRPQERGVRRGRL
jgi:hypothetical protein